MLSRKLAAISIVINLVWAGSAVASSGTVTSAVIKSHSKDWRMRYNGFLTLQQAADADTSAQNPVSEQVTTALIDLLRTEATISASSLRLKDQESYYDYFPSLLETVANLHDVRAAPVLGSPNIIRTGNIAQAGLAALGHPAVQLVVKEFQNNSDLVVRTALVQTASMLLENRSSLSQVDIEPLASLLTTAAKDSSPFVRGSAVKGLISIRRPEAREIVAHLAAMDPYRVSLNGKITFPIRESASKELTLETNGTSEH